MMSPRLAQIDAMLADEPANDRAALYAEWNLPVSATMPRRPRRFANSLPSLELSSRIPYGRADLAATRSHPQRAIAFATGHSDRPGNRQRARGRRNAGTSESLD